MMATFRSSFVWAILSAAAFAAPGEIDAFRDQPAASILSSATIRDARTQWIRPWSVSPIPAHCSRSREKSIANGFHCNSSHFL